MISREELARVAREMGYTLYQAEKDYLQHCFLASLYKVSANEFVFKGGTSLQKAYGLDRYSEDLDFTCQDAGKPLDGLLEKAVAETSKYAETWLGKTQRTEDVSETARLKARGPLYKKEKEHSVQTIVLEFSLREKAILPGRARKITPPYGDFKPYVALCMDLEEVLAEKVRCILTREKPRDVYDASFLFAKKAALNPGYIDRKLAYYGKKFDMEEFREAVMRKENGWQRELGNLMKTPPDFKELAEGVIGNVEKAAGK